MNRFHSISSRIFACISAVIVLIGCLAVPSYAASDDDSSFFDVLDFGTANGSGYQYVTGSFPMQVVYQTIPEAFRYIDIVVTSDVGDLTVNYAGTNLTSVLLSSDGLFRYRFYGNLAGDTSGYLIFTLNGSSGSTVIFESMKISKNTYNTTFYREVGSILVNPYQYAPTEDMESPGSPAFVTLKQESYVNYYKDYSAKLYINNWNAYDYVDVVYRSRCGTIDNIEVELGTIHVPHTISFLDNSLSPDTSWDDDQMYGDMKMFDVLIRLDFTEIDRNTPYVCIININGQYAPYWSNQYCMLNSVTGIVVSDSISPLGTLWSRIQGLFVGLFSDLKIFLTELNSANQEQQDTLDRAQAEKEEMDNVLEDLPEADPESILPDQDLFDNELDVNPFAEFFRNILENPILYNAMRITCGFYVAYFFFFRR